MFKNYLKITFRNRNIVKHKGEKGARPEILTIVVEIWSLE
jgi:hypothetical protein